MQITWFYMASEEDLTMMVESFVGVCRRVLKVNADKSTMIVLGEEEGWECKICVDEALLMQV